MNVKLAIHSSRSMGDSPRSLDLHSLAHFTFQEVLLLLVVPWRLLLFPDGKIGGTPALQAEVEEAFAVTAPVPVFNLNLLATCLTTRSLAFLVVKCRQLLVDRQWVFLVAPLVRYLSNSFILFAWFHLPDSVGQVFFLLFRCSFLAEVVEVILVVFF